MVQLALVDEAALAKEGVTVEAEGGALQVNQLPDLMLTGLEGQPIALQNLAGTVTLIEFWAEWCPPCRSTLAWLGETKAKYGKKLNILGIAVESEEGNIRQIVNSLKLPYPNAMAGPDTTLKFGDILSVPTMFVFDRQSKVAQVFYGAPPDLHTQISNVIDRLLK